MLLVLLMVLAGCPASTPPAASPTPEAAPTPRPSRSPTPTPTPPVQRWRTAAVVGWLYHPDGRRVGPGYQVRVRTGPAARTRFDQTVPTNDGGYGLIGVPSQDDLVFEVVKDGAVVASRQVRFRGLEERPTVSFGGPAGPDDPQADAHPVPAPA